MFTWLLVVLEILVVFGVFWFVYLREPKVTRLKSTIWGEYNQRATADDDEVYLLFSDRFQNGMQIENSSNPDVYAPDVIPWRRSRRFPRRSA